MSDAAAFGRVALPEDVPAIVDLFGTVFQRPMSAEVYRWKLRTRESPVDNVSIAVDERDRLAFHIAGVPRRCHIAGQDRWAMVAVDAMTAPAYRRRGLLTKFASELFARWKNAGVAVVLGMPNDNYGSVARALGWRPIGSLEWLVLPLRPERILARKLRAPWLGRLPFVARAWQAIMVDRISGGGDTDVEVRESLELDQDFDVLWNQARRKLDTSLTRDSSWVAWRYRGDPLRRYRVLKAVHRTGGEILGYLASSVVDPRTLTIPEVFAMPGDVTTFRALVRAAIERCPSDVDAVRTLAVPGGWTHREFRRLGFIKGHRFRVDCIHLDSAIPEREVGTAASWNLVGGDFDVV